MLSPWPWLLAMILVVGSGYLGYRHGVNTTNDKRDAQVVKVMEKMIERHNELAEADVDAAVAAEKKRQQWRIRQVEAQHELELEAERNHRPECDWSERERGLLNNLIDGANGKEDAAAGVPDGLRPPSASDGQPGPRREGVGGARSWRLWRMSVEAR